MGLQKVELPRGWAVLSSIHTELRKVFQEASRSAHEDRPRPPAPAGTAPRAFWGCGAVACLCYASPGCRAPASPEPPLSPPNDRRPQGRPFCADQTSPLRTLVSPGMESGALTREPRFPSSFTQESESARDHPLAEDDPPYFSGSLHKEGPRRGRAGKQLPDAVRFRTRTLVLQTKPQ